MKMKAKTKADLRLILDTMTGADGGGSFVALRWLIEMMDKRASEGDAAAAEVIVIVRRFAGLIRVAEINMRAKPNK